MSRAEFMDVLQKTLSGSLGNSTVNENMRYYQEYFDTQIGLGKSEDEVTGELGNPRLLAKTIIEAAKREGIGTGTNMEYEEVYEDGTNTRDNSHVENESSFHMPGWLIALILFLVLFAVIRIIGRVIIAFLPIIIPAVCVFMLFRFWQKR